MKNKIDWKFVALMVVIVIVGIIAMICVGWSIYAFVKYGDKPITEIPSWALWFMFGGN